MSIEMVDTFNQSPVVKVFGIGGAGGNAVEHMIRHNVDGVEFVCANTDKQALNRSSASQHIHLGESGMGAGSKPEVGRQTAEEAEKRIKETLEGSNLVFIAAGMGGGTGTGAAPVVARLAKEMGILTVGVVSKPFQFEGKVRMKSAQVGLDELEANVDSLIVVQNEKLYEIFGEDALQSELYEKADDVLKSAVAGIISVIRGDGDINVDFNDLKTIMQMPGKAIMGSAQAKGPDRAVKAAESAMASPLLDGVDLRGAKGILVLIAVNKSTYRGAEQRAVGEYVQRNADDEVLFKFGVTYDESLGDDIRVTVVATGLVEQNKANKVPLNIISTTARADQYVRTGTDNSLPVMSVAGTTLAARPPVFGSARSQSVPRLDGLGGADLDDYEVPAFLRRQTD